MNLSIDFTPQTEAWLNAEAEQLGLPLRDLIRRVVEERATVVAKPQFSTPLERIRAMDIIAEKNANLPILSDSAFDRDTIYEDRL